MADRQNTSWEQHLKDERVAYANLALLNIQTSALIDRFYREWLALDSRRQQLIDELEHHSRFIHEHRRQLELMLFPPELKAWSLGAVPGAESAVVVEEGELLYEPFADTLCMSQPSTGKTRAVFEDAIARQVVCWRERGEEQAGPADVYKERPAPSRLVRVTPQPDLLLHLCFVPYREARLAALCRRAVSGDVCVMRSPELSVGRVLVSMHAVRRGDTVMVEAPFFTTPVATSTAADEVLLPPVVREAMALVQRQSAVFTSQGWDIRLLRPFYHWLTELVFGEKKSDFVQRWDELGCPVEDVDPALLTKLSDLAHFLWLSLPSLLSTAVGSEERVLLFFVTLLTNAMNYGGVSATDDHNCTATDDGVHIGLLERGMAVFGGLSLVEHSCRPNAVVVFRNGCTPESVLFAELRATRAIAIGERLTIAYVPTFLSREERHKRLRTRFFFSCACNHCTTGADTTRLMYTVTRPRGGDESTMMCPKGGGAEWLLLPRHPSSLHSVETLGEHYRFNDPCVLDAVRDEAAFQKETDAVDFSGDDPSEVVEMEVKRLTDVLRGEAGNRITPLHHLFLLRALQVTGVAKANFPHLGTLKLQVVSSFLRELLNEVTTVVFVLPGWFNAEFLLGETCEGVMTDDLRDRLLQDGSSKHETRCHPWQEKILVHPLFEGHGTIIVSLWEYYAILCERIGDIKGAVNAWTASLLLLRYGLCQHSSERCLRAQLKALQCYRHPQQLKD
ncbi:putative SET and MYND domain-containing protein 1 isoform X2 [Trypanosoma grayi]|uniref:putative SET and MYND domain-containing protein 1 isoform X2 n=1 Tax=Trypanosoma grayi TaxID=71804 RepID=UPI0004F42FEB|nr:putative SET and MYND domain-containing protein 1 isoform X2 [Trypanosoma grayi]KEG10995.1 putative SET and MYND domain-containing protein 1 isoform X2 [Trypanosoma grayi]